MRVAAIVPAYNEERRIGRVLAVLQRVSLLDEIVVVNDGSTDGTWAAISSLDGAVKPVNLNRNLGKAGAIQAGVESTRAEVLLFMDADLVGLRPCHPVDLLIPALEGRADMVVGVFRCGRDWVDWGQRLVPYISGQRALRREVFLDVPKLAQARAGLEVALTYHAKRRRFRVIQVPIHGVTHVMKEEKLGLLAGGWARTRMYWEIGRYLAGRHVKDGVSDVAERVKGNG